VTNLVGISLAVGGKVDSLNAASKIWRAHHRHEIQIDLASDVMFDFDKADLRPTAIPSLQKVVTVMAGLSAYPAPSAATPMARRQGLQPETLRTPGRFGQTWLVAHGARIRSPRAALAIPNPLRRTRNPTAATTRWPQKNRRVEITLHKQ